MLGSAVVPATSGAAEYLLGGGIEADTEDSLAVTAFGGLGIGKDTWLSASVAKGQSNGGQFDLDTRYFDAEIDHSFDPVGVRFGAAAWGDPDLLDSRDLRAAVYWKNDTARLTLDYERRAFDLTIERLVLPGSRRFEFDADGVGVSASVNVNERVRVYAGGMHYDYSRDISAEPNVSIVRIFSRSRLSVVNSLLDRRVSGGVEVKFGLRVLDVRVSSWRTAMFGDRVDSFGVGYLMPLTMATDVEFRLATDRSDAFGNATVFSVFGYFYGR